MPVVALAARGSGVLVGTVGTKVAVGLAALAVGVSSASAVATTATSAGCSGTQAVRLTKRAARISAFSRSGCGNRIIISFGTIGYATRVIMIEGSHMAACHPVGFQWVMAAKARRAKNIIHVDLRFTRTSAVADLRVPLRAGSDIVFLGQLSTILSSTNVILKSMCGIIQMPQPL